MLLPEFTLYVDDSEESRRVEELLQRRGLRYRRVIVGEKLLGWLLLEYGAKPPVLVAGDRVLHGPEIERLASGGVSDETGPAAPAESVSNGVGAEGERALRLFRGRGCF